MNVKKNIYISIYIISILLAIGGTYYYSHRRIENLENRIAESTELIRKQETAIDNFTGRIEQLIKTNRELDSELKAIRNEAQQLQSDFDTYRNRIKTIESGLSEDINGVGDIIKGIDYYLQQAEN